MASPQPFWSIETRGEVEAIGALLLRRFPSEYAALERALEAIDPLDTVYPNNPGEYDCTIREALVLGETVNGSLFDLDDQHLLEVLCTAARRDFGADLLELDPEADQKMLKVVEHLRGRNAVG